MVTCTEAYNFKLRSASPRSVMVSNEGIGYSVVGFLETSKLRTFLLTTVTQFCFFWVDGNFLIYLTLLLVIFLELNSNAPLQIHNWAECHTFWDLETVWQVVTHACLAWLPIKILSVCQFVKIRCCCLQCLILPPKMMLHTWRKCAMWQHIGINCLFCHPLSPLLFHPP